ncbi:hypothetical protein P154DRAFT_560154 [Amniculicola lignicola CBS 123094]|uniref:Uncharacterized protein n=1 Tax=Amniculicola lignicola CBS 123094 TaxID=1392246 RepID=A0A6A5X2C4_9PLEO|nr:hypothetical protein P154DRAFT_560154 [Amniculicola lignicola CBS 123094]
MNTEDDRRSLADDFPDIDAKISDAWAEIVRLRESYVEVNRLLNPGPAVPDGQLQELRINLNEKIQYLNSKCREFTRQLQEMSGPLEDTINTCVDKIGTQDRWWEGTNILSCEISREIKERLMEGNPPTNASTYAQYIQAQLRDIDLLRKHESFGWDKVHFSAVAEALRIMKMPDGPIPAFQVLLDYTMLVLHETHTRNSLSRLLRTQFGLIDTAFEDILSNIPDVSSEGGPFLHLAHAIRRIRNRMLTNNCTTFSTYNICVHNLLLSILNIMQERAWKQVRRATYLAVGQFLPAELVELVFEHALTAEELPQDPRLIVQAKNLTTGDTRLKLLWPCGHDMNIEWGREGRGHYIGLNSVCVSGPEWVEIPGNVMSS